MAVKVVTLINQSVVVSFGESMNVGGFNQKIDHVDHSMRASHDHPR
jgi:hypothetical protein